MSPGTAILSSPRPKSVHPVLIPSLCCLAVHAHVHHPPLQLPYQVLCHLTQSFSLTSRSPESKSDILKPSLCLGVDLSSTYSFQSKFIRGSEGEGESGQSVFIDDFRTYTSVGKSGVVERGI